MICKNCGTELPDDSLFCFECGEKQEQTAEILENNTNESNSTSELFENSNAVCKVEEVPVMTTVETKQEAPITMQKAAENRVIEETPKKSFFGKIGNLILWFITGIFFLVSCALFMEGSIIGGILALAGTIIMSPLVVKNKSGKVKAFLICGGLVLVSFAGGVSGSDSNGVSSDTGADMNSKNESSSAAEEIGNIAETEAVVVTEPSISEETEAVAVEETEPLSTSDTDSISMFEGTDYCDPYDGSHISFSEGIVYVTIRYTHSGELEVTGYDEYTFDGVNLVLYDEYGGTETYEYGTVNDADLFVKYEDGVQTNMYGRYDEMIPGSDLRYLSPYEIETFDKEELRIARNEIYARHGRIFKSEDLMDYFGSKDWYEGTISSEDFDESVLNEYEKANLILIVECEKNK